MEHESRYLGLVKLSAVAEHVADARVADEGLHAVVQGAKDLFAAQTVAILLLDERSQNLRIRASHGLSATFAARFSRSVGTDIVAEVAFGGMALLLPDPTLDHDAYREVKLEKDFGSAMAVGLTIAHEPVGILYCDHGAAGRFERTDLQVLKCLSILASLAIEKCRLYEEVERLAINDPVTGLYTSNHFSKRLASDIARSIRYGETLGVLLVEIEHLAQVKETYGEAAADEALCYVADLIREHTRGVDYAARCGADQLVVCLVRAERPGVAKVAERIAELTGEGTPERRPPAGNETRGQRPLKISVYLAGALVPQHGQDAAAVIADVRATLLSAKDAGAGRLVMAPE